MCVLQCDIPGEPPAQPLGSVAIALFCCCLPFLVDNLPRFPLLHTLSGCPESSSIVSHLFQYVLPAPELSCCLVRWHSTSAALPRLFSFQASYGICFSWSPHSQAGRAFMDLSHRKDQTIWIFLFLFLMSFSGVQSDCCVRAQFLTNVFSNHPVASDGCTTAFYSTEFILENDICFLAEWLLFSAGWIQHNCFGCS